MKAYARFTGHDAFFFFLQRRMNRASVQTRPGGGTVDTPALGAGARKSVGVQVLSWAPVVTCSELRIWSDFAEAKIAL